MLHSVGPTLSFVMCTRMASRLFLHGTAFLDVLLHGGLLLLPQMTCVVVVVAILAERALTFITQERARKWYHRSFQVHIRIVLFPLSGVHQEKFVTVGKKILQFLPLGYRLAEVLTMLAQEDTHVGPRTLR